MNDDYTHASIINFQNRFSMQAPFLLESDGREKTIRNSAAAEISYESRIFTSSENNNNHAGIIH